MLTSRMYRPYEDWLALSAIPVRVRLHYYIFSLVLIFAALCFFYNLLCAHTGRSDSSKDLLRAQGIVTGLYALAVVLVQRLHYTNYNMRVLTLFSVVNICVCFALAALAAGRRWGQRRPSGESGA